MFLKKKKNKKKTQLPLQPTFNLQQIAVRKQQAANATMLTRNASKLYTERKVLVVVVSYDFNTEPCSIVCLYEQLYLRDSESLVN